ncbi:MAG TPA: cupin domain-containing protein [Dehalococcoidia bacterium]|nr:cupin domain-containing protein [Dehalococcoidia bacterium]
MREVHIVRSGDLDESTAQTPGMLRRGAIDRGSVGSERLWVGEVTVAPATKTGAHHHGDCDSVVCITGGRITIRWGNRLEKSAEAASGDFIYIPAELVHQEINESDSVPVTSIVIRSGDNVVENVGLASELAEAERSD